MQINLKEASTKRGLVMTVTGGIVLYQVVFGSGVADVDALVAKVEWWLGIGVTVAGLLGVVLPDEPKQPPLPPIELQGQSDCMPILPHPHRVQPDVSAQPGSGQESGWNG